MHLRDTWSAGVGLTAVGSSPFKVQSSRSKQFGGLPTVFLYTEGRMRRRMLEFPACPGIKFSCSRGSLLLEFLTCLINLYCLYPPHTAAVPGFYHFLSLCGSSNHWCIKQPASSSPSSLFAGVLASLKGSHI